MNEKAKTYAVGFFNGDLKVYSKKNEELISANLDGQQIVATHFVKADTLGKKVVLVSTAEQ